MLSENELNNIWRTWRFAGIYGIVHVESGKIYVGQSKNIANRIPYHRQPSNKCKYICNAIQKYGWDAFNVFLLEQVDDLTKLTELEQKWIDYFESYKPENGYNIYPAADSRRGLKHSAETRAKISLANTGRIQSDAARGKNRLANTGRIFSNETKEKIGMALRKSVLQLDTKTKILICVWPSLSEAAKSLGISISSISLCCHDKCKTVGSFVWQFAPKEQSCLTPQSV